MRGDGGLCLHLDHVGDRVHRLRARLLRPSLPPRHDGRHQLQLGVRRRVSLWRWQQKEIWQISPRFSNFKKQPGLDDIAPEMDIFLDSRMPFICFIQFVRHISEGNASCRTNMFLNVHFGDNLGKQTESGFLWFSTCLCAQMIFDICLHKIWSNHKSLGRWRK